MPDHLQLQHWHEDSGTITGPWRELVLIGNSPLPAQFAAGAYTTRRQPTLCCLVLLALSRVVEDAPGSPIVHCSQYRLEEYELQNWQLPYFLIMIIAWSCR